MTQREDLGDPKVSFKGTASRKREGRWALEDLGSEPVRRQYSSKSGWSQHTKWLQLTDRQHPCGDGLAGLLAGC